METISDLLYTAWVYLKISLPLQIVTISTLLLFLGVGIQVWTSIIKDGKKGAFNLENQGIAVPKTQRLKTMLMTFICSVALLIAALQSVQGLPPFDGPMNFIYLIAIFALTGGIGVLVQVRSPNHADYPFAILIATALAFMFASAGANFADGSLAQMFAQLIVLGLCGLLAKRFFFPVWVKKAEVVFVAAFAVWLVVFSLA